jgi:hypothetical protein
MPNVNGFTHEDDIVLLDLIREHRELYDVNHKRHKDIVFKDRVWNEISIEIGKSGKHYINNSIIVLLYCVVRERL